MYSSFLGNTEINFTVKFTFDFHVQDFIPISVFIFLIIFSRYDPEIYMLISSVNS